MSNELRPNKAEQEFLKLAYNGFYDIYEEVFREFFWEKDAYYRFSKLKDAFAIYSEIMHYEPIQGVFHEMRHSRPPMESEIGRELFRFLRNVFIHFPFFSCWNDVWINKSIVNWHKEGQSIERFLEKYVGVGEVKYRFWEPETKQMTYLKIVLPNDYNKGAQIFLKDILEEKNGGKFALILMRKIIDTQVEEIN